MEHKRYGYKGSKVSSYHSNFIEYRTLSTLFGVVLGLLFGNVALIAWGGLFFFIGHFAEVVGKVALKVGLVFSTILATQGIIEIFQIGESGLSSLYLALLSAALAIEGIYRKRLLKT